MSRRVAPVLDYLRCQDSRVSILDAGCGLGTESILFACHGADVIGVDIKAERIAVAKRRSSFYAERGLLEKGPEFVLRNVFSMLAENREAFDVIWLNESISHIEPAAEFLGNAYGTVKPGGLIVISDPNNANPLVWFKLFRERGSHLYEEKQDPETGEAIGYAIERAFSVGEISELLTSAGFQVSEIIAHSFVPITLRRTRLYPLLLSLDECLRQIPAMKHLAGSYTAVGRKPY
jgi:SAM-dependent methyltransferase